MQSRARGLTSSAAPFGGSAAALRKLPAVLQQPRLLGVRAMATAGPVTKKVGGGTKGLGTSPRPAPQCLLSRIALQHVQLRLLSSGKLLFGGAQRGPVLRCCELIAR